MKQRCAKEALKYIEDNMIVGLGGGSTIGYLCEFVKEANLNIKIVTPSMDTLLKCKELGLNTIDTTLVDKVDIAFDGCDEVDSHLFALKSGGGIHSREKIIGSMANKYILLVDESKVFDTLPFTHPVVIEVVKDAYSKVINEISDLGGKAAIRKANNKDGGIISDQGLLIIDAYFEGVTDIKKLYEDLIHIVGVLEVSLFVNEINEVLVVNEDGFRVIK